MLVIISGAHGVGKSTLFEALKLQNKNNEFCFTPEVVRTLVEKENIKINRSCDFNSQMRIFEEHHRDALSYNNLISDRGAIDAFVYTTFNYLNGAYTYNQYKQFEQIFLDTIKLYDVNVLVMPTNKPLVADGVRDTDEAYQKQIHELFIKIYDMYRVGYIIVDGTEAQRLETMEVLLGWRDPLTTE